jgi:hypothetical protein
MPDTFAELGKAPETPASSLPLVEVFAVNDGDVGVRCK